MRAQVTLALKRAAEAAGVVVVENTAVCGLRWDALSVAAPGRHPGGSGAWTVLGATIEQHLGDPASTAAAVAELQSAPHGASNDAAPCCRAGASGSRGAGAAVACKGFDGDLDDHGVDSNGLDDSVLGLAEWEAPEVVLAGGSLTQPLMELALASLGRGGPSVDNLLGDLEARAPVVVVPVIGQMFRTVPAGRPLLRHIVCGAESDAAWEAQHAAGRGTVPPCVTHLRASGDGHSKDGRSESGRADELDSGSGGGWSRRVTRHLCVL